VNEPGLRWSVNDSVIAWLLDADPSIRWQVTALGAYFGIRSGRLDPLRALRVLDWSTLGSDSGSEHSSVHLQPLDDR
jgi:hypothetical protein